MRRVLVVVAVVAATLVPTTTAVAACPPADAVEPTPLVTPAAMSGAVTFTGGGWGHGLGLSQYGARGAASLGCTATEIVEGSYPGTTVRTRSDLRDPLVNLAINGSLTTTSTTITHLGSTTLTFRHAGSNVLSVAPGQQVQVQMATASRIRLVVPGGPTWTQPGGAATVTAPLGSTRAIRVAGTGSGSDIVYDRGTLRLEIARVRSGQFEAVMDLDVEDYLLGLAEMPYSWPTQALRAQAVAGRSYAHAAGYRRSDCTCTLYDSTRSQVYSGASLQRSNPSAWANWEAAVTATAGRVITTASGSIITAFYASSHGGAQQEATDAWVGASGPSYIQRGSLARWDNAAADGNGRHRWTRAISAASVAADHGLTVLSKVEVTDATPQGRATEVTVRGWDARGRTVVRTVERGDGIRSRFGLFSNFVRIRHNPGTTRRVAGDNRVATAVEASRTGWANGSGVVVVARADDPADALGGVTLAGRRRAPLLLSGADRLPDATAAEVARLGATTAWVLGGTSALGAGVEAELRAAGITQILRAAGTDRYDTMARAAHAASAGVADTAFVVRANGPGDSWADALAVSGVAARRATERRTAPVLGVGTSGIPAATAAAIRDLGVDRVIVVGGTAVVSDAQEAALRGLGVTTSRWSGANRYLTSADVAGREPGDGRDVLAVTGEDFPDGLAAGALAARLDATLLLVPTGFDTSRSPWRPDDLPDLLGDLAGTRDRVTAVGGTAVVSGRTLAATSWYLTPGAGAPGGAAPALADARTTAPMDAVASRADLTD